MPPDQANKDVLEGRGAASKSRQGQVVRRDEPKRGGPRLSKVRCADPYPHSLGVGRRSSELRGPESAERRRRLRGLELKLENQRRELACDFAHLVCRNHPPAVDDPDGIADSLHVFKDVRRHENRRLPTQAGDELEHVAPTERVEGRARLVEEEDPRRADDGLGDSESLNHTARVATDPAAAGTSQSGHLEQLVGAPAGRSAARAEQLSGEDEEFPPSHPGIETRILAQVADLRPQARRRVHYRFASHPGLSGRRLDEADQDLDRRRLSRPVRAEEAEHRALGHVEVKAVEG